MTASESGGLEADEAFRNADDRLLLDRAAAFYVSADVVRDAYRDPSFSELGVTDDALDILEGWEAMAAAMTLVDEGIRFDVVQTLEAGVGVDDVWRGLAERDRLFRSGLPSETYGFYQELDDAIPGDGLLFYVDTHRIYDQIEWSEGRRGVAEPLRGMGASVAESDDGVTGSLLILIDY